MSETPTVDPLNVKKLISKKLFYIEEQSQFKTKYSVLRYKEKLYSKESPYQKIEVFETFDYGRMLVLDDSIQTTESDEFIYHEVIIHPPMLMHPNPKSVLVIGGGDGGSIEELCKYKSLQSITMVDLDEMVVEAAKSHLQGINKNAFLDSRLDLHFMDGRRFLEESQKKYDVIILDLTDPTEYSKMLFTKEFYQIAANHLTEGGIVSLHGSAWFLFPLVSSTIYNTLGSVFPNLKTFSANIPSYGMELVFMYASATTDVGGFSTEKFAQNYADRLGLKNDLRWIDEDFLNSTVQPKLMKQYLRLTETVSTDAAPSSFEIFYPWEVDPL